MTFEDVDRPDEEDQSNKMVQPEIDQPTEADQLEDVNRPAEMDLTDELDQTEEVEESDLDEIPDSERAPGPTWLPIAAVGLVMLALGMLLGYMGRGQFGPEAQAARATATVQAAAVQTQAAGNQELVKYLASQTRHWKGPEDALVTIIEFSDYQ